MEKSAIFDWVSSSVVVCFTMLDVQSILSIVILILQALYIVGYRIIYPIVKSVRNKKYDEIDDILEDGMEHLEDLQDSMNKKGDKDNGKQ